MTAGVTSPQPRLTQRGRATRERILAAATALIRTSGVAGTSLDAILAASETSKSQLYHYFASKDALVEEVIRAQGDAVIASQIDQLEALQSWAGLKDWRDHIVADSRSINGAGGCPLGSLSSELADQSESARSVLSECFSRWEAHLRAGLAEMQAAGELAADADPEELAIALLSALQGGLLLAQAARDVRPLELALDMAIAHIGRHRVHPQED